MTDVRAKFSHTYDGRKPDFPSPMDRSQQEWCIDIER